MRKINIVFTAFLLLFSVTSYSQVVFEPLHGDVYEFISRLAQKGIIELNDQVKPLPRIYIAEKLLEADCEKCLTPLEKEELEFYMKDYANEFNFLIDYLLKRRAGITQKDSKGRIRLFYYNDDLFKIK